MKMLRYKLSVDKDLSVGSVHGFDVHALAAPPAPPVPAALAIEYPLLARWYPGMALGQNKLTRTVVHRRAGIVQDGHDVGSMIPHVSVPAYNVLTPVQMLFSKRKSCFFEPRIRLERRFATACSMLAWPPTPMMSCNDPVPLPIASMVTNELLGRVEIGMTPGAYAMSYLAVAATMVVHRLTSSPPTPAASSLGALGNAFLGKLAGGRSPVEILARLGVEAAIGLGKAVGAADGARTVSLPMPGSPFLRASVTMDGDGGWSIDPRHSAAEAASTVLDDADAHWQALLGDAPWGPDLG